jgi:hypothetical protein
LLHTADEAVIALSGTLLDLLDDGELTAVLGHELAHRVLWTAQDGRFLVADRLLDALRHDPRTPTAYLETGRRWNLATELYADRGALLACAALPTAISALVKIGTGLAEVDAAAFLAQAEAADPASGSRAPTHPETVLRARALARWWSDEDATATVLAPGLDLDALDLIDRERLERLTRELIEDALAVPTVRTDAVLAHAHQFFPGLEPAVRTTPAAVPPQATEATRRYLAYVLLDLATVDPDLDDAGLTAVRSLADRVGLGPALAEAITREQLDPRPVPA